MAMCYCRLLLWSGCASIGYLVCEEDLVNSKVIRQIRFRLVLILVAPIAFQGLAYLILGLLGLAREEYSKIVPNITALIACVVLVKALALSAEDIGLKKITGQFRWHGIICAWLFLFLMIFDLFVVRISGLRSGASGTVCGLLNYLVVSFWEEIYFRGILYGVIKKRYSDRMALIVSTLLFGLVHFRQGMGMIPKFFTGFLWGAVRYATGMVIFLIPFHFVYNSMWLLFEGDWNHPRTYFYPLFELLTGLAIVGLPTRRPNAVDWPDPPSN